MGWEKEAGEYLFAGIIGIAVFRRFYAERQLESVYLNTADFPGSR